MPNDDTTKSQYRVNVVCFITPYFEITQKRKQRKAEHQVPAAACIGWSACREFIVTFQVKSKSAGSRVI